MITQLDLADIQGNIVKAYGRFGFPVARHICFRITEAEGGRRFIREALPFITTSTPWLNPETIPPVAVNIAFTYEGLKRLNVPNDTLHNFSDEFSMGMKARRDIIGDTGPNHYSRWDSVWNSEGTGDAQAVHILLSINAKSGEVLEAAYEKLQEAVQNIEGVTQLTGHRGGGGDDLGYQEAGAIPGWWDKEHFGYSDGITNTYFEGCGDAPELVIGGGKPNGKDPATLDGWDPIAPGEFLLGHADESGANPEAPGPPLFSKNGTFLVYRKLHQNVASFQAYLEREGARFPGGKEKLAAKFAGRWRNGAPLATFPTEEAANAFVEEVARMKTVVRSGNATQAEKDRLTKLNQQFVAYDFTDDLEGARCPFGSHTRRANPRSALEYGKKGAFGAGAFDSPAALANRRRLLRRGLPYGQVEPVASDAGDHGVIILLMNSDLSRQFEFVQQQWMNFGNDFRLSNDQDPILGNNGFEATGRMMIEGDKSTGVPPYFCGNMPTLVETRGGDYFFVPSMTCLRMLGLGIVDAT